jgi:pimeloyl-ACP methyl ester carboxylesterase
MKINSNIFHVPVIALFVLFGIDNLFSDSKHLPQSDLLKYKTQYALNGKISFIESGKNSLKTYLLLPGIGETKEGYRELIELLSKSGKVYALDLRGQGESSIEFDEFFALVVAHDTIAFMEEIRRDRKIKKFVLVGSSLSAASVVFIGSERPDMVEKIILSGPFVRDHEMSFGIRTMIWTGFRGFWGASVWSDYYKDLHKRVKPKDLEEHANYLKQNLKEKGRLEILRKYLFSSKKGCEEKLDSIKVPVEIVMGGKDPDFDDPLNEAEWISKITGGRVHIFEDAGHYPHREEPHRFFEIVK